uniref:Serpentine Receptor, class H n=1 Tax=Caenorhabditis japonica TaxID=281687 RepID=A0A8R1DST1_CAEJA
MCVPDTSYLSSPDFLIISSHILLCLDIPILSYGAYCILFRTPSAMNSVKWLMLSLHCWSSLLDITLSFFGIPYIFLPFAGGYGLGVYDDPKAWIYLGLLLVVAVDASIILIYENRYYMLYARHTYWARVRKPCLAAIFIISFLQCQLPFVVVPDQPTARQTIIDSLPCPPAFSLPDREMFVLSPSKRLPLIYLTAAFFILTPPIVGFFTLTFYHLIKRTSTVSRKTQQLQRQVIIALMLQSSFLLAFLDGPLFAVCATMIFQYHYQGLNNVIFLVLAMHGIGSTIVMLLVHRPYQEFTFSLLCCRSRTSNYKNKTARLFSPTVAPLHLT